MNIDCPYCEKNIDLGNFDLPNHACDSTEIECPECDEAFNVGWYATAELR